MLLLTVAVLAGAAALWTHPWRIDRHRARIRAEPFHPDTFVVQREQALGAEAPEVYAELAGLYGLQPLAW